MDHDEEEDLEQKSKQDMKLLKKADQWVPDTDKEKNLRACMGCQLILSESQWRNRKSQCVNCGNDVEYTPHFVGVISVFMPSHSWVARWNGLKDRKPGVYAIRILEDDEDALSMGPIDQDYRKNKGQQRKRNRGDNSDGWSDDSEYIKGNDLKYTFQ